jgi:two-component system, chemotaxis family, CheB/CheR fusion protein
VAPGGSASWVADASGPARPEAGERPQERHVADLARRALLQSFAPAAAVTDVQGNVLYVHGDTGKFLRPAPGHPSLHIVDMAREGLQLELREALRAAAAQGLPTLRRVVVLGSHGAGLPVNLSVRPIPDPEGSQPLLLVGFQEIPEEAAPKAPPRTRGKLSAEAQRSRQLERELSEAKDSMRALLEEQQASNEELKSTNEELQSTNEELQSTNEELETSKEELQSVNEELVTVNSELQTKIEQMSGMQDDMKNLLDNIRLGTIFLDRHLLIRRFTRDATQVYRLVATDVGRPLADIRCELLDCDLLADAQVVLDSLVSTEREARTAAGTWYLARIQPYRTVDNVIDGVVLTFADVTERVHAIAARKSHALAEAIVDAVGHPLLVLDGRMQVITANRAYFRHFGGELAGTVGQGLFEIGGRCWDMAGVHTLLETGWPLQPGLEHREVTLELGGVSVRMDARRVAGLPGEREYVLLAIEPRGPAA